MRFSPRSKLSMLLSLLVISSACLTLLISTRLGAHAAGTSIALSVNSGPPSIRVQMSGIGFGNSEKVMITFDSTWIGTRMTDSSGAFSTTITIPSSALPVSHLVQAAGQTSGLSAQTTFLAYTTWGMLGFNPQRTNFNPYENLLTPSNVSGLALDWSYHLAHSHYTSSPAVANGMVYIGSSDDKIRAFNATTGALLWSYTTGGSIFSSPAVANGMVYVGSYDGKLYALDATTGALLWSYTTGFGIESSPTVVNGVVYVGSEDHNLYALNATTGALLWSYTTGFSIYSSPAVSNGVVYVGSYDGFLYALGAQSGTLKWRYFAHGAAITSSPAVANGIVYLSTRRKLYALDAKGGKLLWVFSKQGTRNRRAENSLSSPVIANGVVYVDYNDERVDQVYALNATTGIFLWNYIKLNTMPSFPVVANGILYAGSDRLYAFHLPGSSA